MTNQLAPLEQKAALPSYLKGNEASGLADLGASDFKIPRIKLIQALSPEIREHPGIAIPGQFWHTGLNMSMGSSLQMTPLVARKRVILWRPQEDNGGGMLAFSADGKTWQSGGNQKFTVKLKGVKEPIVWDTKGNVAQSRLLDWGTANPHDADSPPAASMSYEYLCYFPKHPELSPAVMSCNKTALPRAKQFNTALMLTANRGVPIYATNVELTVQEQSDGRNSWFVPSFRMNGFIPEAEFNVTKKMQEQHANYVADAEQDDAPDVSATTEY